jgi:hypothetical protein
MINECDILKENAQMMDSNYNTLICGNIASVMKTLPLKKIVSLGHNIRTE